MLELWVLKERLVPKVRGVKRENLLDSKMEEMVEEPLDSLERQAHQV